MLKFVKEFVYDEIKWKWIEVCYLVGGGYVCGQILVKDFDDQFLVGQLEFGWVLRRIWKLIVFLEKVKSYLVDVFQIGEEIGKKVNVFDVVFSMKFLRDDIGQKMFVKIDWLIEQQIVCYFS